MLIEKAIAKVVANYDMMTVLTPNDAMFILTGSPGGSLDRASMNFENIFDQLLNLFAVGNFVIANADSYHDFPVLGAFVLSNGERVIKMSSLYNNEWKTKLRLDSSILANLPTSEKEKYENPSEEIFFMTAAAYGA